MHKSNPFLDPFITDNITDEDREESAEHISCAVELALDTAKANNEGIGPASVMLTSEDNRGISVLMGSGDVRRVVLALSYIIKTAVHNTDIEGDILAMAALQFAEMTGDDLVSEGNVGKDDEDVCEGCDGCDSCEGCEMEENTVADDDSDTENTNIDPTLWE